MSVLDPAAYSFSIFAVPTLITMLAILALSAFEFWREWITPTSLSFFIVALTVSVWLFGVSMAYLAVDPAVALWWTKASYLGVPFIPPATYQFIVVVLRKSRRQLPFIFLTWLIAVSFAAIAIGTDMLISGVRRFPWGYYGIYGPRGLSLTIFFLMMFLASMWQFWRSYRDADPGRQQKRIRALMLAVGVGYLAAVDFVAVYNIDLYPFGYLCILGFCVLAARAISTYRLDDITPAVAAREIIDTMSDALLVLDPDGTVRVANRAASTLFDCTPEELSSQPIAATLDDPAFAADLRQLVKTGVLPRQELEYKTARGDKRILSLSASVTRNRQDRPVAIVCIARDITENKRIEAEKHRLNETLEARVAERTTQLSAANSSLANEVAERKRAEEERERLLRLEHEARIRAEQESSRAADLTGALDRALAESRLLNAVATAATGHEDLGRILTAVLDSLGEVIAFSGGSIALIEGDDLIIRAAVGPFADSAMGARLPRGRGKSWQVVSEAMPFLSADLAASGLSSTSPVRSFLAVPLIWDGAAFGMLEVDSTEKAAFNETDLALLQKVAAALSGSIQLARLYGQMQEAMHREQLRAIQLRRLSDASLSVNSVLALDDMLQVIADQARETIGSQQVLITIFAGPDDDPPRTSVSLSEKYAGTRAQMEQPRDPAVYDLFGSSNRPVRLSELALNAHSAVDLIAGAGEQRRPLRGWLAAPLIDRNMHRLGLIELSDKGEGEFTVQDEDILVQFAQMAAVAIENVRLLRETEEAVRAREILLSVVSHDLRNLLTAVSASGRLLARFLRGAELEQRERIDAGLKRIDNAVVRMNGLIGELLDFARLQAGQPLDLYLRRTDLVALSTRLAADHQQNTDTHNITVHSELPELQGLWDTPRIERVLDNLLSNAIKYSPRGGDIVLNISREDNPDGSPQWAVLQVRDSGIGIPASDLPHVFGWFNRAGNVTSRITGTGIGLASVAQIVAQHGGLASVASAEGEGSIFTIRLPLVPRNDSSIAGVLPGG